MDSPIQASRPIFLLGNPRSGTSLLSRMLNCHPRICVPYEAHVYNMFWSFRDRYEPLSDPACQAALAGDVLSMRVFRDWSDPPSVGEVMRYVSRPSFHGVFEAVLRAWAAGQGKPRWGEKTPQNGHYWRALLEGFPDAQFIHLVRDGRDCALSWIRVRFGPKLVYPAAVRWADYVDSMESLRRSVRTDQYLQIKYEDLVDESERTLRAVCGFLGEQFHPVMLDYHRQKDHYMTDRRNRENLKQPVIKANTGKWKAGMSLRDQRVFEAVAGRQLARYGYPLLHPGATVSGWERFRWRFLQHPPLRAVAMLRNTKGWGDGLVRLRVRLRLLLTPKGRPETAHTDTRRVA